MIEFQCSECNRALRVRDDSAGKKVRCPQCQTVLVIPPPLEGGRPKRPAAQDSVRIAPAAPAVAPKERSTASGRSRRMLWVAVLGIAAAVTASVVIIFIATRGNGDGNDGTNLLAKKGPADTKPPEVQVDKS